MRLLVSTALLAVAAFSTSAAAATTEYAACTTQQTQQYFSSLSNELSQCQTTSSFDFTAGLLPTTDQRSAVCKCAPLIKQLPNIRVPRCKIRLDGNAYKFKDALSSIFAECGTIALQEEPLPETTSGSGSAAKGEVSGEADATPTPTPTVTPAANSTSGSHTTEEGDVGASDASGSSDTSIETVPEPATTTPVKEKQETSVPATSTTAPTTAPKSSATSLGVWSMATGLVVMTAAMLSV